MNTNQIFKALKETIKDQNKKTGKNKNGKVYINLTKNILMLSSKNKFVMTNAECVIGANYGSNKDPNILNIYKIEELICSHHEIGVNNKDIVIEINQESIFVLYNIFKYIFDKDAEKYFAYDARVDKEVINLKYIGQDKTEVEVSIKYFIVNDYNFGYIKTKKIIEDTLQKAKEFICKDKNIFLGFPFFASDKIIKEISKIVNEDKIGLVGVPVNTSINSYGYLFFEDLHDFNYEENIKYNSFYFIRNERIKKFSDELQKNSTNISDSISNALHRLRE